MYQPNSRRHLVDVLATGAGGTSERGDLEFVFVDADVGFLEFGNHIERAERCLSLALGIEWADASQAMRSTFTRHVAVGERALQVVGDLADADFRSMNLGNLLVLPALFFPPVAIHAVHHGGPVVRVVTAISRLDRNEAVTMVVLVGEQ